MRQYVSKALAIRLVWLLSLLGIALFVQDRSQLVLLFTCYALASFCWLWTYKNPQKGSLKSWWPFYLVLGLASLFCEPTLSDDYYRFAWDAFLFANDVPVYSDTPSQWMDMGMKENSFLSSLYPKLNSQEYYAIYTPINQFFCALPFYFGASSLKGFLVGLKLVYLLFAVGGMFSLSSLLRKLNRKHFGVAALFSAPLFWVEGLLNLHIELVLICLLFIAGNLFLSRKAIAGAGALVIAIGLKLSTLPVLLLSGLLGNKKSLLYTALWAMVALVVTAVCIGSWVDAEHVLSSLRLFSERFEFNGAIYELINGVLSHYLGYNAIAYTGKGLNAIALLIAVFLFVRAYKRGVASKLKAYQNICLVFLLLASTVHPWYLLIPLAAAPLVFNPYLMFWCSTVVLSYTYYIDYEIGWWLWVEYGGMLLGGWWMGKANWPIG